MWLTNSSIGRKVIMSVTGMALVLFLLFHASMNVVALFSKDGYNMICEFLGANWYAVVATIGLAALCLLHIVYAFILTIQNRKARGSNRYAVTDKPEKVEWASQNMLVLGIIVLLGVLLHLFNFWYNMMFAELMGWEVKPAPTDGYGYIVQTFSCWVYVVLYVIWLLAIWFHLTHGFWSAMQTFGWSGHVWFNRWRKIGMWFVTIIMLMFLSVVVGFATKTAPSLCKAQSECCEMQQKCGESEGCGKVCDKAKHCGESKECCASAEECKCEECTCAENGTDCEGVCGCDDACPCDPCDGKCACQCEDCQCENCNGKCEKL